MDEAPFMMLDLWKTICASDIMQKIHLSRVRIPDFVKSHLKNVNPDFKRAKAINFNESNFRRSIYGSSEIAAVNRFKTLKKQIEWLAGRFAVKTAVSALECSPGTPDAVIVLNEPSGAPYLSISPEIPISISHSGDYAVGGVASDFSTPFGLDIERMQQPLSEHFNSVAFTEAERAELAGEKSAYDAARYQKWTLKEAYLKYIRKGFAENLKQVEILNGNVFHYGRAVDKISIYTASFDDYWFSIMIRS